MVHPIVAILAFLSKYGKVKEHLADTISDAQEESLETKDAAMSKMGIDTSDVLHTSARFVEVRIINHQTSVSRFMVTSDDNLGP